MKPEPDTAPRDTTEVSRLFKLVPLVQTGRIVRSCRALPVSTPAIEDFRRVVLKVGSALLVDRARGRLRHAWLAALAEDIAELHAGGVDVVVVSSGAIALGRTVLGLPPGVLRLEESQASAAVGQIALARHWTEALGHHDIVAGQILVTPKDTEERRRYLNARATVQKLLEVRAVPVVNENDTVATVEIRYGDNDRLAARVATMIGADVLVLFSDIDGLYTAPPHTDPAARHLAVIDRITPEIEAMAGGPASELSRGGMRTKVEAAKIAVSGGTHMVIADGRGKNPLRAIREGGRCSWFLSGSTPTAARKTWIAGALEPSGTLVIDDGAARALQSGASLLPVGVTAVEGAFGKGDAVLIRDRSGRLLGRGLVGFDSGEARRIIGRPSREIEGLLGYSGRAEIVHRDDLATAGSFDPI
ncbi:MULTISPECIES: glutamate 5-kinase [Methylobacterium]|uniref:Glutamate 5-kinase n=1 Tax=Methylobacterium thuringiense TaxID=1003091 RepID=A0ABQ4TJ11_9HYPH|nr:MULTISPECIES: glutamate 5-kinase [Methylobacterium]TXN24768.1 glutamate 5-kinase [Methylobacterium sp. WL9]GJE54214.1 Glutamate 5-kinase [Methylobacterium thuringiense]